MPDYDLWITARCAADDLEVAWPTGDGVRAVDHPLATKFVEMREATVEAGDHIVSLREERCYSIHAGRMRGATWFDRDNDVVFMIAAGWHEEGSDADFYARVADRERAGALYPDDADYGALEFWRTRKWLSELRKRQGPRLFEEADGTTDAVTLVVGPATVGLQALRVQERIVGYALEVAGNSPDFGYQQAEVIGRNLCAERGYVIAPAPTSRPLPRGLFVFEVDLSD